MNDAWEIISVLLLIVSAGGMLIVMGIGSAIFAVGPADRAARRRQANRQFTLTDIFTLLAMLQVAITPAAWMARVDGISHSMAIAVWVIMWIAAAALWWASVDMMARAGVTRPIKRATFVLVVLPLALVGVFGGFALPPSIAIMIGETAPPSAFAWWCGGLVLWIALVAITRTLTLWVIAEEHRPNGDDAEPAFDPWAK